VQNFVPASGCFATNTPSAWMTSASHAINLLVSMKKNWNNDRDKIE
jgi:hypothetical protein